MTTLEATDSPRRARLTFDTLAFDVKLLIIAALEELEWSLYNTAISRGSNIGRLHRTTRSWRAATRERVWKVRSQNKASRLSGKRGQTDRHDLQAVAMEHLAGLDYGALHGLLA